MDDAALAWLLLLVIGALFLACCHISVLGSIATELQSIREELEKRGDA